MYDIDEARKHDDPRNRVIMCDTKTRLSVYPDGRPHSKPHGKDGYYYHRQNPIGNHHYNRRKVASDDTGFDALAAVLFPKNLDRDDICAFIPSTMNLFGKTEVTMLSVLKFMPGIRVAVAVSFSGLRLFDR